MIKAIITFVSFLPLIFHSPYLIQAWTGSRLDHWDWIFYLAAVPAAIWAVYKEKGGKCDFYALFTLIPSLFLALLPSLHNINAIAIIAAVGVIFSTVWLLYSWSFAYRTVPVTLILLLGTPSSSYQLSLLMMCAVNTAWAVKFILALLCLLWIWLTRRSGYIISRGTLCFSAAVAASVLFLLHTKELYFEAAGFLPEFPAHCGDFWGRDIQPDENTRRFFATSNVRQYRYSKNDIDISVLAVKCGKDIHEIHPASHCLRTSMWRVDSEKTLVFRDGFAVTEINAQKGGDSILVWVWYSSETFSTPSFLGFRRRFRQDGNYHTYQISIPLYGSEEKSRDELKNFVKALRSSKK